MSDYRSSAKNYVAFVMLKRNRSSLSFREYGDKETGEIKFIETGKDDKGNPIKKWVKFSANQPVYKVPKSQPELIEFIRNYPGTYKSKNAKNPNAPKELFMIAEINEAADAKVALDAIKLSTKAHEAALDLEVSPAKLARIARLVGEDSDVPSIQLLSCVNFAKTNSAKFLELVGNEESEARDLVTRALSMGIIKKKGFMYEVGNINVGTHNEDNVVRKVSGDKELLELLKTRVEGGAETTEDYSDLPEEMQEDFSAPKESKGRKDAKAKAVK